MCMSTGRDECRSTCYSNAGRVNCAICEVSCDERGDIQIVAMHPVCGACLAYYDDDNIRAYLWESYKKSNRRRSART